jgi:hypothetical protein
LARPPGVLRTTLALALTVPIVSGATAWADSARRKLAGAMTAIAGGTLTAGGVAFLATQPSVGRPYDLRGTTRLEAGGVMFAMGIVALVIGLATAGTGSRGRRGSTSAGLAKAETLWTIEGATELASSGPPSWVALGPPAGSLDLRLAPTSTTAPPRDTTPWKRGHAPERAELPTPTPGESVGDVCEVFHDCGAPPIMRESQQRK